MDIPVSLPFSSGITLPTAFAAPVEEGMMLPAAARPPLQSFLEGPSTVFWVAVVAVNRRHKTFNNAEFVVDNFGQRSQAVGRAGSVGNERSYPWCTYRGLRP